MGGWMTDWSSGGLGVEWVNGGVFFFFFFLFLFFVSCFDSHEKCVCVMFSVRLAVRH